MERACRATKREQERACSTRSLFSFPLCTPSLALLLFALNAPFSPLHVLTMSFLVDVERRRVIPTKFVLRAASRDKVQKRDSRNGDGLIITACGMLLRTTSIACVSEASCRGQCQPLWRVVDRCWGQMWMWFVCLFACSTLLGPAGWAMAALPRRSPLLVVLAGIR